MPEKSRYEAQVISNSYVDHDRTSYPNTKSIMSADCWKTEQMRGGDLEDTSVSNQSTISQQTFAHDQPPRFSRLSFKTFTRTSFSTWGLLLILVANFMVNPVSAVFIDFTNCLSNAYQHDEPYQLQFVPSFFNAVFNTTDSSHNLAVRVWGNVKGSGPGSLLAPLPPANDTAYWSSNSTSNYNGKIADEPDTTSQKLTTLSNKVAVLTYEPYSQYVDFCDQLVNASCPLAPLFNVTGDDPYVLPSFGFSNNFYSSYAFTTFTTTLVIKNGDTAATAIGCISANITPDIGTNLAGVIKFLPLVVLICVGVATAFAAIYSPWGTTDTFRWTTNYGRDADLLRLVTPGFGDCLQYIQFVALTGSLTLQYPGFYQPIVSKVSWSALMFNESFVSNSYHDSLVDGIYVVNSTTYGLDRMRQLVGMGAVDDVWAGLAVWLLAIIGVTLVLIQIGFAMRWAYRLLMGTQEEDLRKKNMPFSVGNVIRIVFNYFLLPTVALSMFQLVVASKSPAFTTGLAVLMLVVIVCFAFWLLYFIASTRPKSYLFDDLPTVLTYGALYNTYSDNAAPFALVPVLLTFVRGIAIGAVQPSGIAQLVLLAICEVITVLTLHAFRPFHSPTSMNAYHTFFAVLRFSTILLMIAFAPSLGVTDGPKGWIGYAILLMHAIVLIFGFLLNAIQTIVEVAARLAGAGGDESGAARGGLVKVFGMRQLSRRLPRRDAASRQSQLSSAAMLSDHDRKSYLIEGGRLRSQSAGSAGILFNRQSVGLDSNGVDAFGAMPSHHVGSGVPSSYTPTTPGEASTFSFLPTAASRSGRNKAPILGLNTTDTADPYYRPPRFRRPTVDAYSPGARSRGSWASGDWTNKRWSQQESGPADVIEPFEGPSISGRNSPAQQAPLDGTLVDLNRSKADYTTREVDFYYGVRGPALNANTPGRKIKTGPTDPTGIPASAAGWFKSLFGGKTKEKGKGFEVVRSSRMPPGMGNARHVGGEESPPEGIPVATGGIRHGPIDSDSDDGRNRARISQHAGPSHVDGAAGDDGELVSPIGSDDGTSYHDDDHEIEMTRISDIPPSLQGLAIPDGGMELPSRFPSKASSRIPHGTRMSDIASMPTRQASRKPTVPRKSSRRKSQSIDMTVRGSRDISGHSHQLSANSRLPFERSNSTKRHSDTSARSSIAPHNESGGHSRGNSSFGGHFTEDYGVERPTSVGYVNHHHIHTINPSENHPEFLGSQAELVDGRISGGSSMDHPR